MNAQPGEASTAEPDDCAHTLHEWPVTGPWVDYTCIHCGKTWRLPWRLAMAHLIA